MHISVLLQESLAPLIARNGQVYIDCTLGGGGHTAWLLDSLPGCRVIAIDKDANMIAKAKERFSEEIKMGRLQLVHGDYGSLASIFQEMSLTGIDGLIADLGVSSFQLDTAERGFSFMRDGPLDMRMDSESSLTAAEVVNRWSPMELEKIFFEFGEERFSKKIVRKIVEARSQERIETTLQLAHLIEGCVPRQKGKKPGIHPATRVFQALRIAVNRELDGLKDLLENIPGILKPGGVAAIISFHSLEDRLVKLRFRFLSAACICPPEIMTCPRCNHPPGFLESTKPVVPTEAEVGQNPRARSAKLRLFFKNSV